MIFSSLVQDSINPFFFTDSTPSFHLHLIFDNGIDPDPEFSGAVQGLIFLDEEHNLCLQVQPLGDGGIPPRQEILLSEVEEFAFGFFGKKNDLFTWKKEWPKLDRALPSMIRLKAYQNKTLLRFAFSIPSSYPMVEYEARI